MSAEQACPKCDEPCERDDVDVGVGIIYGPWGCGCGWSSDPAYDRSEGPSPEQRRLGPEWHVDSMGGQRRISSIAETLEQRFGLDAATTIELLTDPSGKGA